ncbi:guanylate-binding protein 5-like [Asterias rubens]|uniref:guanylate-binding protein 5-like n=1 Tax=Asterias rubens TaxID=7604 RepID=UPI001455C523|nr:guanylate-binding protein 5-like [Asterias rubens]
MKSTLQSSGLMPLFVHMSIILAGSVMVASTVVSSQTDQQCHKKVDSPPQADPKAPCDSTSAPIHRQETRSSDPPRSMPSLTDEPLQLVRPDPSHKKIQLVEESVKTLLRLTNPVAVVAVVGKYHSGKSFLLNQLMGKEGSYGFTVGPSLRPQTMGIWMWGRPTTMMLASGQEVSVIFLDTEGFAANNVSEIYDAKVFAVASLLSSFLIYNSVKVIDQADLDYLELLSRRTQLFALKSQLSRAKWAQDFNHDLLSFPPLLWVVQDFVQITGNDEPTPSEWLHEMMKSSAWENENHRISLMDIFPEVECHTLFFPATKKEILQDLSLAREEDLTAEYKVERNRLIHTLRQGIIPKEKNGRPITGAELVALIDVLVTAANEGSLSQIPSRWSAFIQSMEQSAVGDCLRFYETEMMVLHQQYDMGPVDEQEFENWHNTSISKSDKLLQQVLFGLGDVVDKASQDLKSQIQEKHLRAVEMNEKKIKLRCSEIQHRVELEGESRLGELSLPIRTSELRDNYKRVKSACIDSYSQTLNRLRRSLPFVKFLDQLKTSLDNICDSFLLRNSQLLDTVLEQAIQKALEEFTSVMHNNHQEARTPKTMTRLTLDANERAVGVFTKEARVAAEEPPYKAQMALMKAGLAEAEQDLRKKNNQLLKVKCQKEVNGLAQTMRDNTDGTHLPLPVNDTDLDHRLAQEATRAKSLFKELLEDYSSMPSYEDCLKDLHRLIHSVSGQRRQENMEAYSREVEIPLQSAKKIALLSADKYNTEFSLTNFIREVCMLNLDEGKPKHWPIDLKANIVDLFMNSDPDIRRVIKDRQGLWSTLLGFLQWICWLFS